MDWVEKNLKNPAIIGATAALGGGLIKYVSGANLGVEANAKSMGKIFLLVTAAGLIADQYKSELKRIEP